MHGLSKFFHYIVGNIHQVVNGADPIGCKASLHPFGRRSDLYIFYHSRDITRTKLWVLHGYFYII
ncbi:hypothetical protein EVA_19939 [gut metagenome]|uniref:Uncharacterized protein n=1 Tax=gut metagenome TaxID=749906 RepID=J9FBZ0_9ZZZZ